MATSTSKKVIAVRFDRDPVRGYVAPAAFLQVDHIEVLSADGNVQLLPYPDVKMIAFVKDWDDLPSTEDRKAFVSRPKSEGLWVRFEFRDGDSLEALLPNSLLSMESAGFLGMPPDSSRNTQRVFVPRTALRACSVLGVVGSPRRTPKAKPAPADQLKMFD